MAPLSHPELISIMPARFQQSRKLAAMSSSRAISGGIGNSGISVDELVYLKLQDEIPKINSACHKMHCHLIPHLIRLTWFCM